MSSILRERNKWLFLRLSTLSRNSHFFNWPLPRYAPTQIKLLLSEGDSTVIATIVPYVPMTNDSYTQLHTIHASTTFTPPNVLQPFPPMLTTAHGVGARELLRHERLSALKRTLVRIAFVAHTLVW